MSKGPQVYPTATQILCFLMMTMAMFVPSSAVAQETTASFDSLMSEWRLADPESREEQEIKDSLRVLVQRLLSDSAVAAYGEYLSSDRGRMNEPSRSSRRKRKRRTNSGGAEPRRFWRHTGPW